MSAIAVECGLTFTYCGHRLVYDMYGSDAGPLVVYLHGLLLDCELNRGIARALAYQARGSLCSPARSRTPLRTMEPVGVT